MTSSSSSDSYQFTRPPSSLSLTSATRPPFSFSVSVSSPTPSPSPSPLPETPPPPYTHTAATTPPCSSAFYQNPRYQNRSRQKLPPNTYLRRPQLDNFTHDHLHTHTHTNSHTTPHQLPRSSMSSSSPSTLTPSLFPSPPSQPLPPHPPPSHQAQTEPLAHNQQNQHPQPYQTPENIMSQNLGPPTSNPPNRPLPLLPTSSGFTASRAPSNNRSKSNDVVFRSSPHPAFRPAGGGDAGGEGGGGGRVEEDGGEVPSYYTLKSWDPETATINSIETVDTILLATEEEREGGEWERGRKGRRDAFVAGAEGGSRGRERESRGGERSRERRGRARERESKQSRVRESESRARQRARAARGREIERESIPITLEPQLQPQRDRDRESRRRERENESRARARSRRRKEIERQCTESILTPTPSTLQAQQARARAREAKRKEIERGSTESIPITLQLDLPIRPSVSHSLTYPFPQPHPLPETPPQRYGSPTPTQIYDSPTPTQTRTHTPTRTPTQDNPHPQETPPSTIAPVQHLKNMMLKRQELEAKLRGLSAILGRYGADTRYDFQIERDASASIRGGGNLLPPEYQSPGAALLGRKGGEGDYDDTAGGYETGGGGGQQQAKGERERGTEEERDQEKEKEKEKEDFTRTHRKNLAHIFGANPFEVSLSPSLPLANSNQRAPSLPPSNPNQRPARAPSPSTSTSASPSSSLKKRKKFWRRSEELPISPNVFSSPLLLSSSAPERSFSPSAAHSQPHTLKQKDREGEGAAKSPPPLTTHASTTRTNETSIDGPPPPPQQQNQGNTQRPESPEHTRTVKALRNEYQETELHLAETDLEIELVYFRRFVEKVRRKEKREREGRRRERRERRGRREGERGGRKGGGF